MRLRNLAVALLGLGLLAFSALAQQGSMEGNVKGPDGKPIIGAMVKSLSTLAKLLPASRPLSRKLLQRKRPSMPGVTRAPRTKPRARRLKKSAKKL